MRVHVLGDAEYAEVVEMIDRKPGRSLKEIDGARLQIRGRPLNSVEYALLGEDLSDDTLAWISIGNAPTADSEATRAATVYPDGCVADEDSQMGGGGSGGQDNGTMTSGSGSPPSSTAV